MPGHQVFARRRGVIRQAHFPQRQLEIRFLCIERVQVDGHQNEVVAIRRALAEVQNIVVPRGVQLQPQVRLQRWVLPADAIELGDLGDDIAGGRVVPNANLVLL